MIDVELNKPLKLMKGGTAGPALMVPLRQLEDVEAVLAEAGVRFSRSRHVVQPWGGEKVVLIDFSRRSDPAHIQAILDAN